MIEKTGGFGFLLRGTLQTPLPCAVTRMKQSFLELQSYDSEDGDNLEPLSVRVQPQNYVEETVGLLMSSFLAPLLVSENSE